MSAGARWAMGGMSQDDLPTGRAGALPEGAVASSFSSWVSKFFL